MEKEFEALDALDEIINLITEDKKVKYKAVILFCCKTIKQALNELKAIKESNPSEALKGLKHIKKYYVSEPCTATTYNYLEIIEQSLLKAQEQEFNYKNIVIPFFDELTEILGTNDIDEMLDKIKAKENEKVLKVIKEKPQAALSLIQLGKIKTYEEYLEYTSTWDLEEYGDMVYTEEEFDTLKEWSEK